MWRLCTGPVKEVMSENQHNTGLFESRETLQIKDHARKLTRIYDLLPEKYISTFHQRTTFAYFGCSVHVLRTMRGAIMYHKPRLLSLTSCNNM